MVLDVLSNVLISSHCHQTHFVRFIKVLGSILILLLIVYLLGPRAERPELIWDIPELNIPMSRLDSYIAEAERTQGNVRPGNESKIVWADTQKQTPISVVYLHGFGASHEEANPIHLAFAKRYGCNLYLHRLYQHGLDDEDAFVKLRTDSLVQSALKAIAIGKQIGERVIIMSASTGTSLALPITAEHPEIMANICYSPNIAVFDPKSALVTKPWGLQLTRLVTGSDYRSYDETEEYQKYWYCKYRIEGLLPMMVLLEETMQPKTFEKVTQPFFMGYYYKNEEEQDQVVSVQAMLEMFEQLGTPEKLKQKVAFADAGNHIFVSRLKHGNLDHVRQKTFEFAESVLGLKALEECLK